MKAAPYVNETYGKQNSTFADRLYQAMLYRKVSQTELATLINVSQPIISYYLKGSSEPRPYKVQAIAFHLSINYEWLKTGTGRINKPFSQIDQLTSTLSDRILFLLWTFNMTETELGDRIGITYSAIEGWIKGYRNPSWENLRRLSEITGASIKWLVGNIHKYKEELKTYQRTKRKSKNRNSGSIEFIYQITRLDYQKLPADIRDQLNATFTIIFKD